MSQGGGSIKHRIAKLQKFGNVSASLQCNAMQWIGSIFLLNWQGEVSRDQGTREKGTNKRKLGNREQVTRSDKLGVEILVMIVMWSHN